MGTRFTIPDGYHESFRRLLPYMEARLRNDPEVLEALLIYLKQGGEKLARIAIDAFNMNQRILEAEMRKQLRNQVLLGEDLDSSEDDDEDEDEDDDEDDDDADETDDDI